MANKEVRATSPKTNTEAIVQYDFGDDLNDAIAKFGEEVVMEFFEAAATIRLQAGIRSCLERGVDTQAYASAWRPGVKVPSIAADPMSAAKAAFTRMTDKEKAEFLESLR